MRTLHSIAELRKAVAKWRMDGEEIAFVPTMGNLHRGHVELVRHGRQLAPRVGHFHLIDSDGSLHHQAWQTYRSEAQRLLAL